MSTLNNSDKNLIIFIKSTPYENENTFVALSNALVADNVDVKLVIIFIFDGVWSLLPGQDTKNLSKFPNIEDLYKTIITDADFYVYSNSLENRQLLHKKLLPGLKIIDTKKLFDLVKTRGQNILFF